MSNIDITPPKFGGATFDADQDGKRLRAQVNKVREFMIGSGWVTLAKIAAALQIPEASASARLRDLRKEKFGGYTVQRRRSIHGRGLHEYHLLIGTTTSDNTKG